jgi:predicted RNase H-like HicB family nuclease
MKTAPKSEEKGHTYNFEVILRSDHGCAWSCTYMITFERDTGSYKARVPGFPKIFCREETVEEAKAKIESLIHKAYDESSEKDGFHHWYTDKNDKNNFNEYLKSRIIKGDLTYLCSILVHCPDMIERNTFIALAEALFKLQKNKQGAPTKNSRHQEIIKEYNLIIAEGGDKNAAVETVCNKFGITSVGFRKIKSRSLQKNKIDFDKVVKIFSSFDI